MASSARSRPSNRGPLSLPTYQPLQCPLNESALRSLQNLPRDHKLESLKTRLRAANKHLTNAAVEVNERLQMKNTQYEKQKKRLEKQASQEDNEQDTRIADARGQAKEMTEKLDGGVRMIIDSSAEVDNIERALKELQENVTEGRGRIIASQYRRNHVQRRQGADLDDEDSDDENAIAGAIDENDTPMVVLKQKIANEHSAYQAMSMTRRYAQHNDYVGFRKIVHDARYPDDQAPPLTNPSTWFTSESPDPSGSHASSMTAGGNEPIVDDDEDLIVASERISTKCPLTLLTMKDPVTSQKCPHSFEKEAILSMINASDVLVGGNGRRGAPLGQKAMQCPVCAVLLTASDLKENPVLVRKIQRLLAAESGQNEEFSEDEGDNNSGTLFGGNSNPEAITSSPATTRTPRLKSERQSQAPGRQNRQISMVPNSQVE